MNKEARKALDESIKHWERIKNGYEKEDGQFNCDLCKLFLDNPDCKGCPVKEKTGYSNCNSTPYRDWILHQIKNHQEFQTEHRVYCPECERLAINELDFLKSLREKKKYFIEIENPECAIGEDDILIRVVDENGNVISQGNLCGITKDGKLRPYEYFNESNQLDTGIKVNSNYQIRIKY